MRFRNPIAEIAAYHMRPSQGGHHLCYIRLQYTDEKGIVKPCERGILDVRVTGGKLVLHGFPDSFEKDPIMHLEPVYAHRGSFISRMMEKREDIVRIILLRELLTLIAPAVR